MCANWSSPCPNPGRTEPARRARAPSPVVRGPRRRPIQLWECPWRSGIVGHDARGAVGCGLAAEPDARGGERGVGGGGVGASTAGRPGARAGAGGDSGALAAALSRARADRASDGIRGQRDAPGATTGRVEAADRLPSGRSGGGAAGVAPAAPVSGRPEGESAPDAGGSGSARAGGAGRRGGGRPARRESGPTTRPRRRPAFAGVLRRRPPAPAGARLWPGRSDPGRGTGERRRPRA